MATYLHVEAIAGVLGDDELYPTTLWPGVFASLCTLKSAIKADSSIPTERRTGESDTRNEGFSHRESFVSSA